MSENKDDLLEDIVSFIFKIIFSTNATSATKVKWPKPDVS
jgi:hypothetical protein